MQNLPEAFLETCDRNADRPAVKDEGSFLSYREVMERSVAAAERLREIDDSDRVGIMMLSGVDFVCSFFGVVLSGKVAVPLNFMLSPAELAPLVKHSGMKTVVVSEPFGEVAGKLGVRGVRAEELMEGGGRRIGEVESPADSPAALLYTSGTTASPKGVLLSHWNLVFDALGAADCHDIVKEDRFLCALPMFHSYALTAVMLAPLLSGSSVVCQRRFSPASALRAIESERVTVMMGVPPMYKLMAASEVREKADLSSLRLCVVGGDAMSEELGELMEKVLGCRGCQGYGLTEASPVVSGNTLKCSKAGTIGLPIRGVEWKVVGEKDEEVAVGEEGELLVKGDNVMLGYLDMPEETARVLTEDGWLRTGDLARMDEERFVTITGRKKELIICGGINISPYQVEEVVASHPAVAEAAVAGEPDETRGEVVVAYVTLREGASFDEGELRQFCRKSLGGYKVPRRFYVVEEMPRSALGKVIRRKLTPPEANRR